MEGDPDYDGSLDDIRFASYRTASKLRFIQKQTLLNHIDIWNMIEAFRENGLNGLEPQTTINEARMETLLSSLYASLAKRLPPGQNIRNESDSLRRWLIKVLIFGTSTTSTTTECYKVRTVKTVLAAMCSGKLMDKLRYVFSQLADGNGNLLHDRFHQFMKDVSKIPAALNEHRSFPRRSEIIFDSLSSSSSSSVKITVNDFLETMMSDPGPRSLSWLLVLHRIANAESVHHPVTCGSCGVRGFNGLRYKSDRSNYHLCQSCFWRGKINSEHKDDVFKEYNSYKSNSSGRGSSFKKSLQCINSSTNVAPISSSSEAKVVISNRSKQKIPHFPEQEIPLQLGNLLPTPPLLLLPPPPPSSPNVDHYRRDPPSHPSLPRRERINLEQQEDEHNLIAQYTHRLQGQETENEPSALLHSRRLVQELERKNQEIIRDITRLRQSKMHQRHDPSTTTTTANQIQIYGGVPHARNNLINELCGLRTKKNDLDQRLNELQDTRKDLMTELEELMKLLRTQPTIPSKHKLKHHHHHQQQQQQHYIFNDGRSSPESYPANPASLTSLSD